ncbi:MAG: globin [Thermoanaerobaculia bacterium]
MKLAEEEIQLFNDSLDRCIANPSFLDLFYDRFIGGSEAVAAKFADTDMRRQKSALKASLYTAMLAADGNEPALRHLEWLRDRHRGLGVTAGDYGDWLDCLLATVCECGGEFDVRTERVWRKVLEIAIRILTSDPTPADSIGRG